jgi:hypothetical protein
MSNFLGLALLAFAPVWNEVIEVGFRHTSADKAENIERLHSVIPDACTRIAASREESGGPDFFLENIFCLDDHLDMDGSARCEVAGGNLLAAVEHIAPSVIAALYRAKFMEEIESDCPFVDKKHHANQRKSIDAWRLAGIFDIARESKAGITIIMSDARPFDGQVSSDLSFADLSGVICHLLSGNKGSPDEYHTYGGYEGHNDSYYQHPKSPQRHFRLGYNVALGALALIGGLYYIMYAFRAGDRIKAEAAALYVLLGMTGVGVGLGFIFAFGYAY